MAKPIIAINLSPRNYAGLGNRVAASLSGNLNFLTPAVTVLNLQAATTAVVTALAKWSPLGSHGSKADLLDLR